MVKNLFCLQEKKKIKTATKGLENSEQASNDQRNKRSEPLMNGLENTKQSEKPNTRNTKQDTVPEKDLEEMNNNKDRKLRSKEQIDTTKSNIHDKKHAVVNKYDPVRAKAKVITKKAKERGQKLKKKSEADKGAASKQNQDSQQLRRSLREAKITNFKDLFRDPFKKSESLEKVVPKQKDKVNKSITGIEHLLNKKLNENPVVDTTKTLIQPSLNIAPQASNIKFIDPKSVVKRLTQLKEKQRCGRSKRTCEKCGPCKRKDDCGICRFCLVGSARSLVKVNIWR